MLVMTLLHAETTDKNSEKQGDQYVFFSRVNTYTKLHEIVTANNVLQTPMWYHSIFLESFEDSAVTQMSRI